MDGQGSGKNREPAIHFEMGEGVLEARKKSLLRIPVTTLPYPILHSMVYSLFNLFRMETSKVYLFICLFTCLRPNTGPWLSLW